MKILEFGHIPYWAGGRQSTGGANAIYQIAYHLSKKDNVDVFLGATDVFHHKVIKDNLTIYGWTPWILIKYSIFNIASFFKCLRHTLKLRNEYPDPTISFLGLFSKCIFHLYLTQTIRPDIVHLHNNPEYYVGLLSRYAKVVATIHGIFGTDPVFRYSDYNYVHERSLSHNKDFALITFVSKDVQAEWIKTYGNLDIEHVVILNAFDGSSFYYKPKNEFNTLTMCTIASVCERKGQERVLKGIALSGEKIRYICVGKGDESDIRKLYDLALLNNIDFVYLGAKSPDEIREVLVQSDFMVLPSSSEGFGLVYLEAMACGTPVILPKELPIVKEEGIIKISNSILLDDCSEQSIAKALKDVHNYSFNREDVALSVKDYSWDTITSQYLSEMKKILS